MEKNCILWIVILWMKNADLRMQNADLWMNIVAGQDQPGDQPGQARTIGTHELAEERA